MGQEIELDLNLILVTNEERRLATDIANARFAISVHGKDEDFLASEITDAVMMCEADRIASIQDDRLRSNEIVGLMKGCVKLVQDCQSVASRLVAVANDLQDLDSKMQILRKMVISRIEKAEGGSD